MANTLKKRHQQIHLRIPTFEKLTELVVQRIAITKNPKQTADDTVAFLIDYWNQSQPKETQTA